MIYHMGSEHTFDASDGENLANFQLVPTLMEEHRSW